MNSIAIGKKQYGLAGIVGAIAWFIATPWNEPRNSGGFHPAVVDWIFGHFPSIFAAMFAYSFALWAIKKLHFSKYNFAWYVATYGQGEESGSIKCPVCSSTQIRTQRMMNNTFTVAVCCAKCGTTLYYTPETG